MIECFILTEVLEHLRVGTPLIKEISRCLIKGGILIISVPNAVSFVNRIKWLFGNIPSMAAAADCGTDLGGTGLLINGNWVGGHVVDFNKSRLKNYIERANLNLIKFHKSSTNITRKITLPKFITPVSFGNFLIATFIKK